MFFVEGNKIIRELEGSDYSIRHIFATSTDGLSPSQYPLVTPISAQDLRRLSRLHTPKDAIALVEFPKDIPHRDSDILLILDGIQDPGNLGTLIRLADWFGIHRVVCSPDTVDLFNPKTLQATKGSFARVQVEYTDLIPYLNHLDRPIFATAMTGENLYHTPLPERFALILGNEANGIRPSTFPLATHTLAIPCFGGQTESLNVATAAAIFLGVAFANR